MNVALDTRKVSAKDEGRTRVYAQQKATAAKLSSEASRSALPRACTKAKTIMGLGSAMGQRADGPGCELPEGEGASRPSPASPHPTTTNRNRVFCFNTPMPKPKTRTRRRAGEDTTTDRPD